MKRILKFSGSLLGLLVLAALVIALTITFQQLRDEPQQSASQPFQSPIQTPTPPRATPTPPGAFPPAPISGVLTTPIRLTTQPAYRWGLDMDGDFVVWLERDKVGEVRVVMYDLRNHKEQVISSLRGAKSPPRISGHYVVWGEHYEKGDQFVQEIHAYDLQRDQEFILGVGDKPDVSGQFIVWYDPWVDPHHPTVLYDLKKRTKTRLPVTGGGAKIWHDYLIYVTPASDQQEGIADLHLFNLSTSQDTIIGKLVYTPNTPADDYYEIDDGYVLWSGSTGIHIYDIAHGTRDTLAATQPGPIKGHFSKGIFVDLHHAFNLKKGSSFQTFTTSSFHLNSIGEHIPDYVIEEFVNDGESLVWTACAGSESIQCKSNDVFLSRHQR